MIDKISCYSPQVKKTQPRLRTLGCGYWDTTITILSYRYPLSSSSRALVENPGLEARIGQKTCQKTRERIVGMQTSWGAQKKFDDP
jgi:hypothetical protein